jgi:dienelactone hydrolase
MRIYLQLLILAVWLPIAAWSQDRKVLTHDDYDRWKSLTGTEITNNGRYVLYLSNPQNQDGELVINNLTNDRETIVPRGAKAAFSSDNSFAIFHIEPPRNVVRQAKVDKKKKDEMPKDSLGILLLESGNLIRYEDVLSYRLPKEPSPWLAFAIDFSKIIEESLKELEPPIDTVPPPPVVLEEVTDTLVKEPKTEKVKQLVVKNPSSGSKHVFDFVENYQISENGRSVIFLQEEQKENNNKKDTISMKKLYVFNTEKESVELLDSLWGDFKQLSVNKTGDVFAWLFSADTAKTKVYDLFVLQQGRRVRKHHITTDHTGMPEGFSVSEHYQPSFSDNGQRVFLGLAPKPEEEKKDTLLDEENYKLDIWHWQDPLLQSQQKVNLQRDQRRSFEAVLHLSNGNLVPMADADMPEIRKDRYSNAEKFMGLTNIPYQMEISWLGSPPQDVYMVDTRSGTSTLVLERHLGNVVFSVHGNFILYYEPKSEDWYSYSVRENVHRNLTGSLEVAFYNEDNDVPAFARPYGIAGWGEKDSFVLVYDRYDIWKLDPAGREQPVNLTSGFGRQNNIRFRYQNLDPDEYHIPVTEIYLSAFNPRNKQAGYYRLDMKSLEINPLIADDASFAQLKKSKDGDVFIWTRSTFNEFPDLWKSDLDFSQKKKVSDVNPQQSEYLWGKVSLVDWLDFRNDTLQGLLYLPENFDPEDRYPMIVYFYERSSDGLHRHWIPSPSRSIINPSYCTSNGYIVFVPDITYREGFPGQSAYNAIVSGTKAMVERYPFINRHRMALQGQSWGGYQIAYLVTQTNMFRAAMAGAPVSNMVSAYGGIRWTTGLSRQFQYEQTQSRIGGTLWEKPLHYIENSPVFFADKIETPLLMMHNDDDGAVPWYQGVELFVAMRRLGKPVWMLVYNGEEHNLMQWPNRVDLSIRMYQFFDHYLKDKPAPQWLLHGRPYIEKEKTDAYELVE